MSSEGMEFRIIGKPATAHLQFTYTQDSVQPSAMLWEEGPPERYVCRICKKTFYNAIALQNHRNLQHDADGSSSEPEQSTAAAQNNNQICLNDATEQIVDGLCGFKFIPKREESNNAAVEIDGLTKCMYNEDTSYLLLKVDGDDCELTALKRSRLAGIIRRNQIKQGKQPVDLRGPFTCTLPSTLRPDVQCRQIFFNCCEYSRHYREEHTKRRKAALRCQVCERRLDREGALPAAQRPAFACRACGLAFESGAACDEHVRLAHAKSKPHQCSVCAKRFTQQGGLQQHMRMHTGVRPFACTYCPKAFTQKAGLDQHLRTHTKVKPFKCVVCGKCFSQSVHLRQHMRTHTNIQPFECAACGRRFKQSSHLNFHMRSHAADGAFHPPPPPPPHTPHPPADFFSLANVQPVRDGETLYYAAELQDPLVRYRYQPYTPN